MARPEDRWVVLRLRSRSDGLWAAYEDDSGVKREPPALGTRAAEWTPVPLLPGFISPNFVPLGQPSFSPNTLFVPFDLRQLVYEAQPSPPAHLPLFVQAPHGAEMWPWESAIDSILRSGPNPVAVEVARLARDTWVRRSPLSLPLRILAVELESLAALEGVRSASWYVTQPHVRAYGLHIGFADKMTVGPVLWSESPHIVIAPAADAGSVLESIAAGPDNGPRVLILFGAVDNEWDFASLELPHGTSLIRTPWDQIGAHHFIEEIVLAVIHDQPLHDAVAQARSEAGVSGLLVSDPDAAYDLRLSAAGRAVLDEAAALDQGASIGDVEAFLARVGSTLSEPLRVQLQAAERFQTIVHARAEEARAQDISFDHESLGLTPVSKLKADLSGARAARAQLDDALRALGADPAARRLLEQHQQRSIDVTLDQLDRGLYRPLGKDSWIMPAARCRVAITIGHQSAHSVLLGDPVPLDPLLPDLDDESGYTLEIVVFEKDFTLLTPRVQLVTLPRLGGTAPVYFELRAPEAAGPANLRISVFHKNHLLQSFTVQTQIGVPKQQTGEPLIGARLDFCETERFANLEELGARVLSLGVNRDGDTHSLFVKKDRDASAPMSLSQDLIKSQTAAFRAMLQAAMNQPFDMDPKDGAAPSPHFEQVIRQLAEFGKELARALSTTASDAVDEALWLAADPGGGIIQVTRHDPNFVFPWHVVYDYDLPPRIHGLPPRPVCLGRALPVAAVTAAQSYAASDGTVSREVVGTLSTAPGHKGCPHNPGIDVCCIYGFWGVRYQIEQLIAGPTPKDALKTVTKPRGRSGVCAATAATDEDATAVIKNLQKELGASFAELPPQTGIDELFWDPARRPAVFLALGHLETAPLKNEPVGPRIALLAANRRPPGALAPGKWLHAGYLIDWKQARRKGWEGDPRPLVLLMACSAGATQIDTLNDFVKSLNALGAAAIIGTECPVYSRLVARFSREVIVDVWTNGMPLGAAIQNFTQRLLKAGNPLAFAFTLSGSADLQFV
jgi:hypothetical protein